MASLKGRSIALVSVLAFVVVSAGCWADEVPSMSRIGASRSPSGDLMVEFAGCPGETVESVTLRRTDESFSEMGEVLWEVEATNSAATTLSVVVGLVPDGFSEKVPLINDLSADLPVEVIISSSRVGTLSNTFKLEDLRTGEVLVPSDRYSSLRDFRSIAADGCSG